MEGVKNAGRGSRAPGGHMIARVWHGYTTPEHADAYEAML
jgi:hypothetical protein